ALNANATAQYNPQGASTVKADLQVTNLVVSDPKGQLPATPLEAKMRVDASLNKQVADVRQLLVSLTPTARATNQIQLTGHVDMSQTNAIQGNLKLAADSLDFTSYYDLFAGQKKAPESAAAAPATPTPAPAPAATPARPEKEPEPTQLPFRNFTAETIIGRFYLHEVEITNLLVTARIDGGHVLLNPCQLALNGAPVKANVDLDLGVPGYKYDTSFSADSIPLAPLVNSFTPERKGQLGGTLSAQARVAGAGVTGASLQKNLNGQFDVGSTNLNLALTSIKQPMLRVLVNVITSIPELARNPGNVAGALLGSLTQKTTPGTQGGLASELSKSPIDKIVMRGSMGNGQVNLQQAVVQSPAFVAEASGTVALAPVLTNSTLNVPVSISLSRALAERVNMVPANTPTNVAYVKLPEFYTMGGTVGNPKNNINYMALAGAVAKGFSGGNSEVGKAANMLQGFLGGKSSGTNTNAPGAGTNQPGGKAGGLLQGLGGFLGGNAPAATNPSGSAINPPATNQSPVDNLLNQFLKKK
ncbi:MAG TPA: AsmA family protein, partial [Bacillota bacterium]|nr:AsmA family protein [Bacillota bacterium]